MNAQTLIQRVLIASVVFGAIAAALMGYYYGPRSAISSLVGSVIAVANFALLAKLATAMLDENNPQRKRAGIWLGVKFVALVTIVGVLVINHIVRGGAFMAGVSAVVAAIALVGLCNPAASDSTHTHSSKDNDSSGAER
jgi:ABC-type dipeptide/oligopeptide/nickel transport system permease subunit